MADVSMIEFEPERTRLGGKVYDIKDAHGDAGEALVGYLFSWHLKWPFRKLPRDLGLDGEVELIDASRCSTGQVLKVQVKSKAELSTTSDSFGISVSKRDVLYWQLYDMAVVLCAVDLSSAVCYWAEVDGTIDLEADDRDSVTVRVPVTNVLDINARKHFEQMASRRQHATLIDRIADKILIRMGQITGGGGHSMSALSGWTVYDKEAPRIRKLLNLLDGLSSLYPWLVQESDQAKIKAAYTAHRVLNDWQHELTERDHS